MEQTLQERTVILSSSLMWHQVTLETMSVLLLMSMEMVMCPLYHYWLLQVRPVVVLVQTAKNLYMHN